MTATLAPPVRVGRAAVGALGLLAAASRTLESVVAPTLPLLQRELSISPAQGALLSVAIPTFAIMMAALLVHRLMPDDPPARTDARIDWPGLVLLSGVLLTLMLGHAMAADIGSQPLVFAAIVVVLAGSLAGRDHAAGFAAYERDTRDFVTMNQDLVGKGGATLFPTTAQSLEQRNNRLRSLSAMPAAEKRPAHSALTLPDFAPVT